MTWPREPPDPDYDPADDPCAGVIEDMPPTPPTQPKPQQVTLPQATTPAASPAIPVPIPSFHDQALLAALPAIIAAIPGTSDPAKAARLARAYADALVEVRLTR